LSSLHVQHHIFSHAHLFSPRSWNSLIPALTLCHTKAFKTANDAHCWSARFFLLVILASMPFKLTKITPSPANLQPDPSLVFPIPYLPARILLSPPPYRDVFAHNFSTSTSSAISPTTIPTIDGPKCLFPIAAPFAHGTAQPTNLTVAGKPHGVYNKPDWSSKCSCHPQAFPEPDAVFPWTTGAWMASNPPKTAESPVRSTESYVTHMSGSSRQDSDIPIQQILLERWLREQARFHFCDDFADQTDFVQSEKPRGGRYPGPRQVPPSQGLAASPERRSSERSINLTENDEEEV